MERGRVMKVAFAGAFAAQMAEPVRARLSLPCEFVVEDEQAASRAWTMPMSWSRWVSRPAWPRRRHG